MSTALYGNKNKKRRLLWHSDCSRNVYQIPDYTKHFINIRPKDIDPSQKLSPKHFTLSLAASGTNQGLDIKSGQFFKNAQRSRLWPDATTVDRSSVSKARAKVACKTMVKVIIRNVWFQRLITSSEGFRLQEASLQSTVVSAKRSKSF
jgi:hypothetical protein